MALTRINNNSLSAVTAAGLPANTIVDVKQAVLNDTYTTPTGGAWYDIPDLSITITPQSASSKILITSALMISGSNFFAWVRLMRDSTQLHVPTGADTFNRNTGSFGFFHDANNSGGYAAEFPALEFLDEPQTDQSIVYKLQVRSRASGGVAHINRTPRDDNNTDGFDGRGVSTLTVMEIAG